MATTLEALRSRVQKLLQDEAGLIYTPAALDESIRLALGDYALACGAIPALAGLDGAQTTSLPGEHETLVVIGAAGYAASARTLKRAEGFQLHPAAPEVLRWAGARLDEFRVRLEQVRLQTLHRAAGAPWAATGWKDAPGEEE